MKKGIYHIRLFFKSFAFLGDSRKKYVLGIFLGAFELALLFAVPVINRALIDIATGKRDGNIMMTLAGMLLMFLLFVPPVVIGKYMQATAAAKGTANLRKTMFGHIARLPYETVKKYKTGDYITRLTDDANRTTGLFGSFVITNLIRFVVVFSATLLLLLSHDWRMALVGIVYSAINLAASMYLNPLSKRLEREAKGEIDKSASFLLEVFRGIPIVRVFTLQQVLSGRYRGICELIRQKRQKYRTVVGITYGVVDFFAQSAQAVGFMIGIVLAGENTDLGQTVFNATLIGMMGDSVYRLSTFLLLIQPNFVAMERVFSLLELPPENLTVHKGIINREEKTVVRFRDVSFSYDKEKQVLDTVNLTVSAGEHLAIVGGSGSGKSTVIKLMEGFYAPDSGEIMYYGQAGNAMSRTDIRRMFSYVPQECILFDGSIGDNIAMGKSGVSQADIEEAARAVGIHSFIEALPNGYDTLVGERGGQLSGGQKQRIAIARAVLRGAPILLLDEATAALDAANEKEIQNCLDSISDHMATVTVAHRLSTIRRADRILVMEDGKVVEEGTFDDLMQRGGKFKILYESQAG